MASQQTEYTGVSAPNHVNCLMYLLKRLAENGRGDCIVRGHRVLHGGPCHKSPPTINYLSMPIKFTEFLCAAAVACGGWFCGGCVTRPVVNGIPNFAQVEAGIYRGGQPTEEGWKFLNCLGVTNVVKLNREVADTPPPSMTVFSFPLPPATMWEACQKPRSNDVRQAVQAMERGGTFVHCRRGRDRTGLVVGCYRVWIDGWSKSAAAREMDALGYRWSLPGLAAFWKSVKP